MQKIQPLANQTTRTRADREHELCNYLMIITINKYMNCIEEVVHIPVLLNSFQKACEKGNL